MMENRTPEDCRESTSQCRRKANQHWEMAIEIMEQVWKEG